MATFQERGVRYKACEVPFLSLQVPKVLSFRSGVLCITQFLQSLFLYFRQMVQDSTLRHSGIIIPECINCRDFPALQSSISFMVSCVKPCGRGFSQSYRFNVACVCMPIRNALFLIYALLIIFVYYVCQNIVSTLFRSHKCCTIPNQH